MNLLWKKIPYVQIFTLLPFAKILKFTKIQTDTNKLSFLNSIFIQASEIASFPTTYPSSLNLTGFTLPCDGTQMYTDVCVNHILKNHVKGYEHHRLKLSGAGISSNQQYPNYSG